MGLLSGEATWEDNDKKEGLTSYIPITEPLKTKGPENDDSSLGVSVYKLMCGEQERDWDLILITIR